MTTNTEINHCILRDEELKKLNCDLEAAIEVLLTAGKEAELKSNSKLGTHEEVARKVFRRLLLRNAQLSLLTELTIRHFSSNQTDLNLDRSSMINIENEASKKKDSKKGSTTIPTQKNKIDPSLHAYKHAITDLFVEKALTYLEEKADYYSRFGRIAYYLGLGVILIGIIIAIQQYFFPSDTTPKEWIELTSKFTRAFTLYGMIVLAAVGLWRFGRAMLDQAERLLERRHALRQGRLFVHLHDGEMSIEDMEKAFNWNVSNPNAFSDMSTDAKAPWGAVATEIIKGSTELATAAKSISENLSKKTEK